MDKINPNLNLHVEVMSYEQMLEPSEKRHEAFFKAVGSETFAQHKRRTLREAGARKEFPRHRGGIRKPKSEKSVSL